MKNILIPVDFSEVSANAVEYLKHFARTIKCHVVLFHNSKLVVVANEMLDTVYTGMFDNAAEVDQKLEEIVKSFKSHGISCEKQVAVGLLADDIKQAVADFKIDMIVTGTSGASGLDGLFFGTTSVTIFEHVSCPVLVIPVKCNYRSIKKILYATDFKKGDEKVLEKICTLARMFEAEIIVSHINTDAEKFTEEDSRMDQLADLTAAELSYNNISYNVTHDESVFDGLEKNITSFYVDLICMAKSEKRFFKKLISKSNTREMAFHSRIPLLVTHLNE
ncbi:MAG: universal stress protein [Cytophaga sp.]|uniref:universal stress protein n=1 Tax=Cytophaga sp. TaxID=29535 RepID=UPI003F7E973F